MNVVRITLDKDKAFKTIGGYLIILDGKPKEIINIEFEYVIEDKNDYNCYAEKDYYNSYISRALWRIHGTQGIKNVYITYEMVSDKIEVGG